MNDKGFITLDRKILTWGWYTDVNTKTLFIHCLLKANYKAGAYKGMDIPRGTFVTSYNNLAKETGLSVSQVRTALKHLELTCELTRTSHPKFLVITVNNYDLYQRVDMMDDIEMTLKSHHDDNNLTKEQSNNINNIYICPPDAPTSDEVKAFFADHGLKGNAIAFFEYHNERGWKTPHGTDVTKDWKKRAKAWKDIAAVPEQTKKKPKFDNFEQRKYESGEFDKFFIN